jgi:hypothetical protein
MSTKVILIDPDKIDTVGNWSSEKMTANGCLNNLLEVQQFLGFWNYNCRIVKGD